MRGAHRSRQPVGNEKPPGGTRGKEDGQAVGQVTQSLQEPHSVAGLMFSEDLDAQPLLLRAIAGLSLPGPEVDAVNIVAMLAAARVLVRAEPADPFLAGPVLGRVGHSLVVSSFWGRLQYSLTELPTKAAGTLNTVRRDPLHDLCERSLTNPLGIP